MPTGVEPGKAAFKVCSLCGKTWESRDAFLADPEVRCAGYQVHYEALELGLFFFNHTMPTCRTTLAVNASQFTDLYDGPIFAARLTGTEECPGYCQRDFELRPCPAECECAYVRAVLDMVAHWEKIDPA
jgi:hypothetical protein